MTRCEPNQHFTIRISEYISECLFCDTIIDRRPAVKACETCDTGAVEDTEISKTQCSVCVDEFGKCDNCDNYYELASRDGRCGDCGECSTCCNHDEQHEQGLVY